MSRHEDATRGNCFRGISARDNRSDQPTAATAATIKLFPPRHPSVRSVERSPLGPDMQPVRGRARGRGGAPQDVDSGGSEQTEATGGTN